MLPGRLLLHPVILAAVATLVANDHWAKARFHNTLTGVLSDIAGMVFFPALLLAVVEWSADLAGRSVPRRRTVLFGLCVLTAVVFALTKTTTMGNEAYRVGLGALQWPFALVRSLLAQQGIPPLKEVSLVRDPMDLIAVPFAFLPLALATRTAPAPRRLALEGAGVSWLHGPSPRRRLA